LSLYRYLYATADEKKKKKKKKNGHCDEQPVGPRDTSMDRR
jgi:hypothetical protein